MNSRKRQTKFHIWVLFAALGSMTFVFTIVLSQQSSSWPQWGHDQEHTGTVNVAGQNLNKKIGRAHV